MSRCVLALDSATVACSAALWHDGRALERFEVAGREHSRRLLPMVHALLAEAGIGTAQLDGIVCGIGPGSFSGVRIGVGIAKGLAFGLGLAAVGVSSLAMLAQGALREHGARRVLAALDAGRGEAYVAGYADGRIEVEPQVTAPDRLAALAPGRWHAAGGGWKIAGMAEAVGTVRIEAEALPRSLDALTLGMPRLAEKSAIEAAALAPLYLREQIALDLAQQRRLRAER